MAIRRDASELLSSFGSYGVEQRKQAVSAMSDAFDRLDRQTDAVKQLLENSLTGLNEASRKQAEKTLSEIDQQRSNLADLLDQARSSSDDAWDSVKDQFVDATSGLLEALEKASA
jgi:vacuolar-type H+-ATPase subunit I/STV1